MEKNTDMAFNTFQMVVNMKETLLMVHIMVMEPIIGQMVKFTQDSIRMIPVMVLSLQNCPDSFAGKHKS